MCSVCGSKAGGRSMFPHPGSCRHRSVWDRPLVMGEVALCCFSAFRISAGLFVFDSEAAGGVDKVAVWVDTLQDALLLSDEELLVRWTNCFVLFWQKEAVLWHQMECHENNGDLWPCVRLASSPASSQNRSLLRTGCWSSSCGQNLRHQLGWSAETFSLAGVWPRGLSLSREADLGELMLQTDLKALRAVLCPGTTAAQFCSKEIDLHFWCQNWCNLGRTRFAVNFPGSCQAVLWVKQSASLWFEIFLTA